MNIIKPSTLEEERIIPSEVPLDGLDLYGPFIETITLYALPDFPSILFPIHTDPFTRMVDRGDHSDNPVPSQRCRASDEDFVCSSTEIYMYRGTDNPNISIDVFSSFIPANTKNKVFILTRIATAIISGFLAWAAWSFVQFEKESESILFLDLPVWIFQLILPYSFITISFRFLLYSTKSQNKESTQYNL